MRIDGEMPVEVEEDLLDRPRQGTLSRFPNGLVATDWAAVEV